MKYQIAGESMQALNIILEEGEKIYADSGHLLSKSDNISMTPRIAGGLIKAIERKATGSTAMLTEFQSKSGEGVVSVSGTLPGKVVEVDLGPDQGLAVEHSALLAVEESVNFTLQRVSMGAAFWGGAGLMLQKFIGPGKVFIHVVGDTISHDLDGTNHIEVDPGHIAAFDSSLNYTIRGVDNVRTAMFGGVGLFLANFTGTGRVILHSVSKIKLATELYLMGKEINGGK
ncbi:MAG: TIGR00266 family protein [Candidatus Marsarchaeota archaeon]|nr:TIGR00266 family protein [Candidatus Marsarchaeota archaeon]MCL5112487.1 TIGR00266 family protein [Candidatus Marsarchaeota archaeon]